jgi:DNA-binding transcriptional LysR family regulator
MRFTILSRTSREILQMLDTFEAEAGITYLDNEPLGKTETLPLYAERYVVVCARGTPMADRDRMDWADLNGAALALLTPDMQNRRIIDRIFADCGVTPETRIDSNSIIALVASVVAGHCMAVLPTDIARFLSGEKDLALVPLDPPDGGNTVGLVLPRHDPRTPVLEAVLAAARDLSPED